MAAKLDDGKETVLETEWPVTKNDIVNNEPEINNEAINNSSTAADSALNSQGYTKLHTAAGDGQVDLLKSLLSDHVLVSDVNRKTFDGGYAPLHLAVVAGRVGCVEELLKCRRTESDITDFYGRTPLDFAEQYYRKDVAKLLRGNSKTPCVCLVFKYDAVCATNIASQLCG